MSNELVPWKGGSRVNYKVLSKLAPYKNMKGEPSDQEELVFWAAYLYFVKEKQGVYRIPKKNNTPENNDKYGLPEKMVYSNIICRDFYNGEFEHMMESPGSSKLSKKKFRDWFDQMRKTYPGVFRIIDGRLVGKDRKDLSAEDQSQLVYMDGCFEAWVDEMRL